MAGAALRAAAQSDGSVFADVGIAHGLSRDIRVSVEAGKTHPRHRPFRSGDADLARSIVRIHSPLGCPAPRVSIGTNDVP